MRAVLLVLLLTSCTATVGTIEDGVAYTRPAVLSQRIHSELQFPHPVDVIQEPMEGRFGYCTWQSDRKRFLIAIRAGEPRAVQHDVVIHEWAHIVVWHAFGRDVTSHDAYWGVAYARCFRAAVRVD